MHIDTAIYVAGLVADREQFNARLKFLKELRRGQYRMPNSFDMCSEITTERILDLAIRDTEASIERLELEIEES